MKILPKEGDKSSLIDSEVTATLKWKAAVDLDLHCFYLLKSNQPIKQKGFIKKLLEKLFGTSDETIMINSGHICFRSRGSKQSNPFIYLDKDSGVGDTAGNNEENIYFTDLTKIENAIIVANIFNKSTNFSKYDGEVVVKSKNESFKVPLICKTNGSWCVIARIDNTTGTPHLININKTMRTEPKIENFI